MNKNIESGISNILNNGKPGIESMFNFLNIELFNSEKKLNDNQKKEIISNLSILLKTGINIKDSIEIILNDYSKDKNSKRILSSLNGSIKSGKSFTEAIELSGAFKKYEIFNIRIGEETGQLAKTILNLSDYINKRIELRRKIVNALSYPIIVLCTAILAVTFMLTFVVPMFEDIFKRFGQELPYLTQVIINMSANMKWIILGLIIMILLIIVINNLLNQLSAYQEIKSKFILNIPVIGDLLRKIQLARFASAMELFISADIPVHKAIALIREMSTFYPLKESLKNIENRLLIGENFYESIDSQPFFDKRIVAMVKVGMETNKLDEVFKITKENYYEDISYKTSILNSVLEPIMIVFIGLIVAVILIGMYLPIFKLSMSFDI